MSSRRASSSPSARRPAPLPKPPVPLPSTAGMPAFVSPGAKTKSSKKEIIVWGDYVPHEHLSKKNIVNAILCAIVLLPSVMAVYYLYTACPETLAKTNAATSSWKDYISPEWKAYLTGLYSPLLSFDVEDEQAPYSGVCEFAMSRPVSFANALFFLNVTVGFWLIGLVQRSFWLIDPYWTIIPPLLGHLYRAHPNAEFDSTRSYVTLGLLWVWALRLTHSYFRREDWKFGEREDWRYTKMAKDYPKAWPILSFFAVGLAQQPMLVGISLPAYTVHFAGDVPFGIGDALAVLGCVLGLLTAWKADNELREYMTTLPRPAPILETGLWYYSRHPNYFGEQLWWWSFGLFAVLQGEWYVLGGTAFNSVILATVTLMTEERMLTRWTPARAKLYREYMRTTSPCIPWFKRA